MENSSEFASLLDQIVQEVHVLDIAGYLKEEVRSLCKYLHAYKLKNIWENFYALKEYLYFLDEHSTKQLAMLEYDESQTNTAIQDHDISYYLSQRGVDEIGESRFLQKLNANDSQLTYAMQGVKGFLLLTADEFCNATPTRLSITRMDRQKKEV